MIGLLAYSEYLSTADSGRVHAHNWRMTSNTAIYEKIEFSKRFEIAINNSKFKGLSNVKLGKKFGLSQTMVWECRNAKKMPSVANGVAISKLLKVSFEWLMTGRETEKSLNFKGLQTHNHILDINTQLLTLCVQAAIDNIPEAPAKAKAIFSTLMYEAKTDEENPVITEIDNTNVINLMMKRVS